jgi:hypothetical protein
MKKTYVGVLITFVMVLSVFGAGCTNNQNFAPTALASPTPTQQQHDTLLETWLIAQKAALGQNVDTVTSWNVTWNSPNSVTVLASYIDNGTQWSDTITTTKFNTTEEATAFLNANTGGYDLDSSTPNPTGPWSIAAGHAPTVYREYKKDSGSVSSGTKTYNYVEQLDNYIKVTTKAQTGGASPTPTQPPTPTGGASQTPTQPPTPTKPPTPTGGASQTPTQPPTPTKPPTPTQPPG